MKPSRFTASCQTAAIQHARINAHSWGADWRVERFDGIEWDGIPDRWPTFVKNIQLDLFTASDIAHTHLILPVSSDVAGTYAYAGAHC